MRTLLVAAAVAAVVVIHLMFGTWAVLAAARWLPGVAIGLAVAVVITLHLAGLRKLRGRNLSRPRQRVSGQADGE